MTPENPDLSPLGFRKTPFTRELAARERFVFPHHDEAVDALATAVKRRMSAALIAPAGSGKTVLLRALKQLLPDARYLIHYVKVTGLSKRDLCKEIAAACQLSPAGNFPALVRKLQEAFEHTTSTDGLRPVLILDEAHDLRPESLAMLRLLTNFDMDARLVLSVIVAGQTPLRTMLSRPLQEDIAQRLCHVATLRLVSRDETKAYIAHRCALAGAHDDPFDDDAREAVFEISRGNLRAIDRLALKSIELAAAAGAKAVSAAEVIAARKQLFL